METGHSAPAADALPEERPVEQSPDEQLAAAEFLVATRMREESRHRTARMLEAAHRRTP